MCIDQLECLFWRRTMFQEYFESECLMVILYRMLGNGGLQFWCLSFGQRKLRLKVLENGEGVESGTKPRSSIEFVICAASDSLLYLASSLLIHFSPWVRARCISSDCAKLSSSLPLLRSPSILKLCFLNVCFSSPYLFLCSPRLPISPPPPCTSRVLRHVIN